MFFPFILIYSDKKIKESDIYKNKKQLIVTALMLIKYQFLKKNSFKHCIGYNDNDIIRPLCIKLPQMTGYTRKFDKNVTISFTVNNKQLFKNYNKIWEKIEKLLNIHFESKLVYGDDDKYVKTKIKIYAGSIITNFHNKKMPKEKAPCKCLSIIMIDSVIKANKKYYPQTLLEECKYIQEKIKTESYINENLEKSESDSDSNNETESDIDSDE